MRRTTAGTTKFAIDKIEFGGWEFYFDGNQKITASNGTFDEPVANAFSLPHIETCPGSTPTCRRACYVHHLEKGQPEIYECYQSNEGNLREMLDEDPKTGITHFAHYIRQFQEFRWHVSGDVFSGPYARFIVDVCADSPNVQHWIYTRSFVHVPTLVTAENLRVNLSSDDDNYVDALRTARENPSCNIAHMTVDGTVPSVLSPGDILFPDYGHRNDEGWRRSLPLVQQRALCPVDYKGKSETVRCGPCRKCID